MNTKSEQYHKTTHFQNPKLATKYPVDMSKHMQAVNDLLPKLIMSGNYI